ncbi:MAG TPA: hypothetical protein VFR41_08535 [Acidimicrobiia bacterium]|nr:hypothetical protein [Acidimicrobiia bacterium]
MIHRLQARAAGDEAGLTLVEMLATIIIMGLIIGPLSMAMVEALNIIPQSGQRTQSATDYSRLQQALADDASQAQLWENFANNQSVPPIWLPAFSARPLAKVDGNNVPCPSPAPALNASFTFKLFTTFHRDGVIAGAHNLWQNWQVVYTNTGLAKLKMEIQRYEHDDTAKTDTPWDTLATGYCTPGANNILVTTFAPQQSGTPGYIKLTLSGLSDKNMFPITNVAFTGDIRTSYS